MIGDDAIEVLHRPRTLLDKIYEKLNTVIETLMAQAEKLTAHGKYKDAEYICTQIMSPSESIRWGGHLTIKLAPKMLLLYEKTGNQSAAEMMLESLLRAECELEIDGDAFTWLTEKLCQKYNNFYDRVNNIVLGFGEDESSSAEYARTAVFYRTATLDIDALSRAVTGSQWILVPKKALCIAAKVGAFSLTSTLVGEDDRDINLEDECGNTALHLAAREWSCELLQVLIDAHADLEIADDRGKTALLLAAGSGSERGSEKVKCLLDAGANINVKDYHGRTPLHLAARFGTPETVKILLRSALDVDARNIDNETPLLETMENLPSRRVPIAQQLLDAGATLNHAGVWGVAPLMKSSQLGDAAMIDIFLKHGHPDLFDRTLALHATLGGPPSVTREMCISMLLKAGVTLEMEFEGRTALGTAMWRGWLAAARQLLEQGANVETEIEGERLLCYSVRRGDESATRLLLEKGADARQENHKGESPLIIAVAGSWDAIVEMLLESGGLIIQSFDNTYSCQIENPVLHCAIQNSSLAIIEMLLKANRGYLLTKDKNGNTALHKAILQDHERHEGILDLLLKYCDDYWDLVDQNWDCNTPLHLAVSLKRFKTAKMLLATQPKAHAYHTVNTVHNLACQEVGSLLSLVTIEAEDPCFEAFEELKRLCQTLTP